jgi:hypothetical protein
MNDPYTEEQSAEWKRLYIDFLENREKYYPIVDEQVTTLFREITNSSTFIRYNRKGEYLSVEFVDKNGSMTSSAFDTEDIVFYAFYATATSVCDPTTVEALRGLLILGVPLSYVFITGMNEGIQKLRELKKEWGLIDE